VTRTSPGEAGGEHLQRGDSDQHARFECQVTRTHDYKRQLLNAPHGVVIYYWLWENWNFDMMPRTFCFAGMTAVGEAT
jgi:glucan phosphorylase